jgi:hypothetical protein
MTRGQRTFHRLIWPALGLVIALGVALALYLREPPPARDRFRWREPVSGAGFRAVQWNRHKIIYDAIVLACVIVFVTTFLAIASWMYPPKNAEEAMGLRIQAFGTCAFVMLTVILSIGPLTRLNDRGVNPS